MTANNAPTTWLCDLYELDHDKARFSAGGATGCRLEIPAMEWVALGRPGSIQITPTAFEGFDQ